METTNVPSFARPKKGRLLRGIAKVLGRILALVLETAVLLVIVLYGVMYILAKGPSPTARDIFVMSVRETSAVGFLADLYFTQEEIAAIEAKSDEEEFIETDTSLIVIPTAPVQDDPQQLPVADEWGLVDEDGDGIIIDEINGEGYSGYMMVVLDPSRVIMGCRPEYFGVSGLTVAETAEHFGAVAAINAGGFEDLNGKGHGETPDTMLVYEGRVYYGGNGIGDGFVGIDSNYIMHVGKMYSNEVQEKDIQYGVSFGPVLVANGEITNQAQEGSGVNPRTAIGQRSDGAILMMVIDGRQLSSLGATYKDLAEIFLSYGAVNACNLDGGSSTLMWYEGEYLNNCASVIGIRDVPTTFLVLPKEDGSNG